MSEFKKEKKTVILCDNPEQRKKNIDVFVRKFKEEHKDLMDRLSNDG